MANQAEDAATSLRKKNKAKEEEKISKSSL